MNPTGVVRIVSEDSYHWRKDEPWRLVECVVPRAEEWLPAGNPFAGSNNYHTGNEGRRTLVGRIYEHLRGVQIHYDFELPADNDRRQRIRTVLDIFRREQRGTCLDLTLAFCGICEGCGLIPCIFLLSGHALAGVWLDHRLGDWNAPGRKDGREGWNHLVGGSGRSTAEDAQKVLGFVKGGKVLAVECTGFARGNRYLPANPEGVGRDGDGLLDFDRAVAAGTEQLERAVANAPARPLLHVLDIAVGRYDPRYRYEPLDIGLPPAKRGGAASSPRREAGVWPYRVDRQEQADDLREAIQGASTSRRPPVCLVVGSINDDHTGLVRRAVGHDLVVRDGPPPDNVFTDFPDIDRAAPGAGFEADYLSKLNRTPLQGYSTIEELAGILRLDPRRWVITSLVELAPDDPRIAAMVEAVAGFWSRVGEHLGEISTAKVPLVWLQVVPCARRVAKEAVVALVAAARPQVETPRTVEPADRARCFRPLALVRRPHLEAWRQHLLTEARDLAQIDPRAVIADLFPEEDTAKPMLTVSERLARLIESRDEGDS